MPQKTTPFNWLVYHYEYTNDDRRILIYEPNLFDTPSAAEHHCNILAYLSGQSFQYIEESKTNKLPLFKDV